ncbi:MAG: succinate dehydrogenase/fumarate reductase iron-sulfur subunit [Nitrospirae bacterium]|nr:succinate dehydrogenase/fumarate reductase iron-sulfur subunit [Nitrospirota bacterium]
MADQIQLTVSRYNPDKNGDYKTQTFSVPYHDDWSVLDALNYIKSDLDGSLSFRWSCRMAVCGSCGMMVNGTPRLTCSTYLNEFYPGSITIEPLANFPVVRDLVVDLTDFMNKLKAVKPWIIRENPKDDEDLSGEYLQTPAQMDRYRQQSLCINCTLCYAACPVYGLHSDFVGPAVIALAYRYNEDSRDQGREDRRGVLADVENGVWKCTVVGDCTEVCPKHVDPSAAIQRTKVDSAMNWFASFLTGGSKKR